MENYLLCGTVSNSASLVGGGCKSKESTRNGGKVTLYKGRRRGSVEFVGIWKHERVLKELVSNGVKYLHKLNHENVLKFCEWYETSKHVWVITELTSGGTLAQILEQDCRIPPGKVGDFFVDMSSGLGYLHSVQILYCDLQPEKIVLDTCEKLKLSDFSLARASSTIPSSPSVDPSPLDFRSAVRNWLSWQHQNDNKNKGEDLVLVDGIPCPLYAAPELFQGAGFSEAGDMWALGCVTVEIMSGRQPFSLHCSSTHSLESAISQGWSAAVMGDVPEGEGRGGNEEEARLFQFWSNVTRGLMARTPARRCSWEKINQMLTALAEVTNR